MSCWITVEYSHSSSYRVWLNWGLSAYKYSANELTFSSKILKQSNTKKWSSSKEIKERNDCIIGFKNKFGRLACLTFPNFNCLTNVVLWFSMLCPFRVPSAWIWNQRGRGGIKRTFDYLLYQITHDSTGLHIADKRNCLSRTMLSILVTPTVF